MLRNFRWDFTFPGVTLPRLLKDRRAGSTAALGDDPFPVSAVTRSRNETAEYVLVPRHRTKTGKILCDGPPLSPPPPGGPISTSGGALRTSRRRINVAAAAVVDGPRRQLQRDASVVQLSDVRLTLVWVIVPPVSLPMLALDLGAPTATPRSGRGSHPRRGHHASPP